MYTSGGAGNVGARGGGGREADGGGCLKRICLIYMYMYI